MRASGSAALSSSTTNCNHNSFVVVPAATLHITIRISSFSSSPSSPSIPALASTISQRHTPALLPSGVISVSPPFHSSSGQPKFIPHRPTFCVPSTSRVNQEQENKGRHAALIAHLNADLREERAWERVERKCMRGRGGY